ncbi:MAG: sulfatase-like hydrolase/transferase [Pirellulaceae bacterium]|nr:sulfatase-like hydrolase/transferase [Pirellulaceae bacterium]
MGSVAKHEPFEGGTRVPFVVRWRGKVPPGRVDTANVTSFMDWLPTLCSIAAINELPDQLDGENVSDTWFGENRTRKTRLFGKVSSPGAAIAMRDD